ncbi:3'(2'),5'-bisphosphate nucleotidase CysQ [Mesonia sp. K4-1]|uniref:3'(2'),5'-bisphosphate nucleotidase CysQ n=1 Tax=Mesonia sp. K4-1 TaxID=2602760 RepID=UPI001C9D0E05|nr:3'(2'),5'-bisphosphate nucleotidase CysQ [Mesonia sp. K4-1]
MMEIKKYLPTMIDAARDAGIAILEIYNSDEFETIKNDAELNQADLKAHRAIENKLADTGFPILSEDGKEISYAERKDWEYYWLIDPLDGTKEFLKKNDEFTVNIALMHHNEPILGVIFSPVLDKLYFGGKEMGAFMDENMDPEHQLKLIKNETDIVRIVTSRSHHSDETKAYISNYENAEVITMGSSLKFMLIADSEADLYPRFSPTMEWDTAAAHAILRGMQLDIVSIDDQQPLKYNKKDLLNPSFMVSTLK